MSSSASENVPVKSTSNEASSNTQTTLSYLRKPDSLPGIEQEGQGRRPSKPSSTIFIGNIGNTSEYAIIQLFSKFGKIKKLNYLWNMIGPDKGTPRGYCFLEFEQLTSATEAIKKLHGKKITPYRHLVVNYATSEEQYRSSLLSSSSSSSSSTHQRQRKPYQQNPQQQGSSSSRQTGHHLNQYQQQLDEEENDLIKQSGLKHLYGTADDKIKALERKLEAMKNKKSVSSASSSFRAQTIQTGDSRRNGTQYKPNSTTSREGYQKDQIRYKPY